MVDQVLLNESAPEGCKQPGVGSRLHLQVDVGHRSGFGSTRIDHDHRSLGILGDLLERDARARDAVGLPGVLAYEKADLAVLEIRPRDGSHEAPADPELTGLLLR